MSNIIELLEEAGRSGRLTKVSEELAGGLASELRSSVELIRSCYVSAPDNEPTPSESPAEVPDEPDQQDSEAA